jgi:hypothetical protein
MIKLKDLLNEAKPSVVGNVNAFGPSKVLGKGGKVLGFVPDTPNAIATLIQDYPTVQAIEFKSSFFFNFKSYKSIKKGDKAWKELMSRSVDKPTKAALKKDFQLKESVSEATLTEKKYYVTYNLGRGRGKDLEKEFDQKTFKTTNKPKVFNSYNDAKKYAEKMEKMFQHSIGGGTAYWVSDEKMNPIKEAKSDYEVYHKSYTSAIQAARAYAEKKGYEINNDDAFTKIGMGPRKPSEGKTNKFSIELSKDGKVQRKKLQIQVYGMRNSYELNAYIQ